MKDSLAPGHGVSAWAPLPETPLVSVVIAVYNGEQYIAETLRSILAQTYQRFEIIVVDDGSTDRTVERLREFGRAVRYFYEEPSGSCSKPRNLGIAHAKGELVTVLDADDLMTPDKLERQVAFLRGHPTASCVLVDYQNFNASGPIGPSHFHTCPEFHSAINRPQWRDGVLLDSDEATRLLVLENFSSSSLMVRKEVFGYVGMYDESLKASEDFDLQYRISTRFVTGVIGRVGFLRRIHDSNMSADVPRMLRYKILSRSGLLSLETEPARRRLLKHALAQFFLEVGYYETGRNNRKALASILTSLRYRRWPARTPARTLARLFLSPLRPAPSLLPDHVREGQK